jgi:hypothetical protein
LQKGRQREQIAISGGQPRRRTSVDSDSAALNPQAEASAEVEQTSSHDGLASPLARRATPTRKNNKNVNGAADVPISGPLIGDELADGTSFPGIAGLPHIHKLAQTPEEVARARRARRRLSLWAGFFFLLVILVIETLVLSPWTDPSVGQAPRQVSDIPLAEVNQYGVNVFLHKEVDQWKSEHTLELAHDMGAGWIKQQFPWAEIEFAKDSYWDPQNKQSAWTKFDNIVDLAEQHGLRIIARIDSTPAWARADDNMPKDVQEDLRGHKGPPSPSHLADFSDFVRTFVSRYKGRIAAIQVWNEPNLRDEWYPSVNAKDYVTLLYVAYTAAKYVDPNMIVLAAPLATTNETLDYNGNLNELDYLQAIYYAGAKPYFDAMSANAYGKERPPEDPPSRNVLNFRRVELLRKVMEENRDSAKAIWFNEYGWNASPANCCASFPWGRVTPEQQADYTVRGIEYAHEHWPWAGVFTIWYLRQVGDISSNQSEYYFSLLNTEFVPVPTYWAVKKVAHDERQVATTGQWGPLSPVISAGPDWQVHLNPDVPGGVYVAPSAAAVDTGDSVRVLFQGTDVKLTLVPLGGVAPSTSTDVIQARYYISVDGGSSDVASGLQRDDKGRAYIDLPVGGQATEVTVVHRLGAEFRTSQHELRITAGQMQKSGQDQEAEQGMVNTRVAGVAAPLADDSSVSLPGIAVLAVEVHRSYLFYTLMTLLLVVAIGLEALALWRSRPAKEGAKAHSVVAGSQGADGR